MSDIDKILEVAKDAAFEAGVIHMQSFGKNKDIQYKGNEFDLVTNVDKSAEEKILSIIQENFPEHAILGEEGGNKGNPDSEYLWIIDPLDGTTNYTHNFPHFASSVGVYYQGKSYVGVVYDAFKEEMFFAAKDKGAFLNARSINVTEADKLSKSLLATGFPYSREGIMEENLKYFKEFLHKAQAVRRPGAAALDLCYVACGRLDGFWELNLSPWDVAAGVCIIEEAGGKVTNINEKEFDYDIKNIIASNNKIHEQINSTILNCK